MNNQQLLTIFMTILFLPTTSTWAHHGNQHELTLETNMTLPGNQHDLPGNQHDLPGKTTHHTSLLSTGFINRIYQPTQEDQPAANPRRPTSPITMSSEQTVWTVWTNRLNPSEQPIWTTPKINPHRNTQ